MDKRASIVIATYGNPKWQRQAERVAYPSAKLQGDYEIILYHDEYAKSPAEPRNVAAAAAQGEHVCFLDSDDELESGYIDACLKGNGEIRYPRVRYIPETWNHTKPLPDPIILPKRSLLLGNHIVVGALLFRSHFLQVGGFDEHETWEDWALFLKLTYIGDRPILCLPAIYRVYRHAGSRVHDTKDPIGTCKAILDHFRNWAIDYDGGMSKVPEYQNWMARYPVEITAAEVMAEDKLAEKI